MLAAFGFSWVSLEGSRKCKVILLHQTWGFYTHFINIRIFRAIVNIHVCFPVHRARLDGSATKLPRGLHLREVVRQGNHGLRKRAWIRTHIDRLNGRNDRTAAAANGSRPHRAGMAGKISRETFTFLLHLFYWLSGSDHSRPPLIFTKFFAFIVDQLGDSYDYWNFRKAQLNVCELRGFVFFD